MNKTDYINSEIKKIEDFKKRLINGELKKGLSEKQILAYDKLLQKMIDFEDKKIEKLKNLSDEDYLYIQESEEAFKKFAEDNNLTEDQLLELSDEEYDELLKTKIIKNEQKN